MGNSRGHRGGGRCLGERPHPWIRDDASSATTIGSSSHSASCALATESAAGSGTSGSSVTSQLGHPVWPTARGDRTGLRPRPRCRWWSSCWPCGDRIQIGAPGGIRWKCACVCVTHTLAGEFVGLNEVGDRALGRLLRAGLAWQNGRAQAQNRGPPRPLDPEKIVTHVAGLTVTYLSDRSVQARPVSGDSQLIPSAMQTSRRPSILLSRWGRLARG